MNLYYSLSFVVGLNYLNCRSFVSIYLLINYSLVSYI